MTTRLEVLAGSVEHLRDVASQLSPDDYLAPAYPSNWTIADTFSHLGSGAVIGQRRLEDAVRHRDGDPAFNTSVWDEWNAKSPSAQVADCLTSDAELLAAFEATDEQQRIDLLFVMGPFTFDFDGVVGLRLSEHVLHTWDIEVATDARATLASPAASAILDSIQFIVARSAKPTGEERVVTIRTLEPVRDFELVFAKDSVDLIEAPHEGPADLELPAEAFVRLIYGRLDAEHTPSSVTGEVLDDLRSVFPGF